MKTLQNLIFILISALILQGCIASKPESNRKTVSSSVKSTTPKAGSPEFPSSDLLYWFNTTKVDGTLTVNQNSDIVTYLRGSMIHNFLSSKVNSSIEYYRNTYCLVGTYPGTNKQIRLRAVPIYITNYANNSIERILRIDVPSRAENAAACGFSTINTVSPSAAAYSLTEICPGCTGGSLITTTALKLFISNVTTSNLTEVPATLVTLASVALRVDLSSNSSSGNTSCSNTSCEAKGFDCCIEGQCVKDASQKANASLDPQYSQAISDYATNPLSFINYPNIYNICTNISHTPPPATNPGNTPVSDAMTRVNTYLADYTCIDKVLTTSSYSLCLPGASEAAYLATKKKLAIACGCPSGYDDTTRAIRCPDWGVKPLYKSTVETIANIVDFYCYTPTPANPIGTITNLNVVVSSRSAPHRFYSTGGTNYDDLKGVSSSIIQEGDDFYYLDQTGKTSPVNESFNMNSILGRIDVGLSQTQPAKMVGVELGKTYIISTTSGFFTPCTKCAKDSWFQTFSAHPSSSGGNGLRASGFTTARDNYSANATLGNYEDTKFGRACYLPATMIPFSHKKDLNLQTQRLNRLKTQAAFYINGYQRDWFGFNKGAMLGSFDGVTWFAIGSGRRVTAISSKLYLAYNGAFLDLADRTDTIVNIIPDLSANTAPDYDYDPELGITDKLQNMAGTCQKYHQCQTDTDCVTQLGWEYSCTDMSQLKTNWPVYDTESKEITNQEKTASLFEILGASTKVGTSAKRCVYRGAGAPCVRDYTALDNNFNQKAFTCAPNFYCASLTTNKFNDELARSPNEFDDIFFGMDTNVLGRPKNYVTANKTLASEAITNIKYNGSPTVMGLTTSQVEDMGICRPGRSLSTIASTAHSNPDTAKRSDYISQVGSCDSTAIASGRVSSCPIVTEAGDIATHTFVPTNPFLTVTKLRAMQNSCGAEAKHPSTFISAFSNIEGGSLALLRNITSPILAADACMRRAGSVCFSDLDCGPNRMHSDAVSSLALTYFGGTQAEQSYWQENLICGQGAASPALGSAEYNTYELNKNRCCREVGKDFTMYTAGPATIVPENMGTNVNLVTSRFSITDPKAANRYSRYTASETAQTSASTIPTVNAGVSPAKDQWRVINETGTLNCCGGGWVRKFADGTHDWTVKNRLSLETSNFQCLNFRSPLASPDYNGFTSDNVVKATYQREYEVFCKNPASQGCLQILLKSITGFSLIPPQLYDAADSDNLPSDDVGTTPPWTTAAPYTAASYQPSPATTFTRLDTSPVGDILSQNYTFKVNSDTPYQPFPYTLPFNLDLYDFQDGTKSALSFFAEQDTDYGVSIYLPAYVPYNLGTKTSGISRIYIKYFKDNRVEVVDITHLQKSTAICDSVVNPPTPSSATYNGMGAGVYESWCVSHSAKTQNRPVLVVKAYNGSGIPIRDWDYAGVIIDFEPIESVANIRTAVSGSEYYYLTKLGKLELIGIPQITYEPIYCNNNQDNLVPGIFTSTIKTRAQFNAASSVMSYDSISNYDEDGSSVADSQANIGNNGNRFTFQDKLAHAAVFSSKEFTCCTPLGKNTASAAKCCSGFATTTAGKLTCKLPVGTDLNVYFNKFVSSDGVGETLPGGGLILSSPLDEALSDFNEYTGEPKLRSSTFMKLEELGRAFCANGSVDIGGAFGEFPPEPFGGSYDRPNGSNSLTFPRSIVDSIIDAEESGTTAGKYPFDNGFRWNHHFYCK